MRSLPKAADLGKGSSAGWAGSNVKHESAYKHVSGEALYVDDIPTPSDTLHAYAGFSAIARGKIKSISLTKVENAPGVVSVLRLADVPGHTDIGAVFAGDPILLDEGGEVEFYGQAIFAVAASSYDAARKAALLAEIEYLPLQADLNIEQGLAKQSFVRPSHTQARGDAQAALTNAEHTLKGELQIGGQEHMYLEGQVSLAVPAEDGGIVLYTSTQNPSEAQKLVAEVLAIPMHLVTVETRRMGGGFGGKESQATQPACWRPAAINGVVLQHY